MTGPLDALYQGRDYDVEWGAKADDLPFWLAAMQRYRPSSVLELAVGTGRIAIPLARAGMEAGFTVTGLDITSAMLEQARRRLAGEPAPVQQNLTLVQGDMRRLELERQFDLVLLGFNSIIHLLTADDQIDAFSSVRRRLTPGGRFIVDVFNPTISLLAQGQQPDPPVRLEFVRKDETTGARLIKSSTYRYFDAEQRMQSRYIFERYDKDDAYQTSIVDATYHEVFPRELELLYRMSGFVIEEAFGDYDWSPFVAGCPRMIMVGRRHNMDVPGLIFAPDPSENEAIWQSLAAALPWLAQSGGARLRVIEVAGDGYFVEKFAVAGHTALLLNADHEVLDAARDRLVARGDAIVGTVALVRAPVAELDRRWQAGSFDVVLCHQVFDRSFDPRQVLETLTRAVRPGGHLSLAFQDRASAPVEALNTGDPHAALALLRGEVAQPPGLVPEDVAGWLGDASFQTVGGRAIGSAAVRADGGDDSRAPAEAVRLLRERGFAAAPRFQHIVARRPAVFPIPL